jgi:hypothetical protein
MPIPSFKASSVEKALEQLLPQLDEITASTHDSTKYDLLWRGHRFPPKVVVRKAVEIEHGIDLPESEFSGGRHSGQANAVLEARGFVIVPKDSSGVRLPLGLFGRYGRKDAFASIGIKYDPQQQYLNVGLSPRCRDNGYLIFITLNKEELDPAHDYADELFAEQLIWVTRRAVTEDQQDYVNLRLPETRVSLFVRTNPREDFVYAGEMEYEEHNSFKDPSSGRPQMRFVWRLKNRIPDLLLQELTFGVVKRGKQPHSAGKKHSRAPSSFDELKKAYSYVLGTAERTVVPEHQNYQVRLTKFLADRGVRAEMEKDFVDVSFSAGGQDFIGEIKVSRNLTLAQAFRAALGQLLDYGNLLQKPPAMIMLLDQTLDQRRLKLASMLKIAVVVAEGEKFVLLNPDCAAAPQLKGVFWDFDSVSEVPR